MARVYDGEPYRHGPYEADHLVEKKNQLGTRRIASGATRIYY